MPPLNCGPSLQDVLNKIYARLNAIQGGAGGGNCDLAPVLLQLDQIETYLSGINGNTSGLATMINGVQSSVNQSLTQLGEIQTAISLLSTGGGTVKAAIIYDQKVQGANGGTFTAGAWRQRELNTKIDPDGLTTVASNTITITNAGKYYIAASAPAYGVNRHQCRLLLNSALLAQGTSEYCVVSSSNRSIVHWSGQLLSGNVISLEHRGGTTFTTYGFGVGDNVDANSDFGVEIFSIVEIIKLD